MTPDSSTPPPRPAGPVLDRPVVVAGVEGAGRAVAVSPSPKPDRRDGSFFGSARRFFLGGLKALLPTLITLWLLFWVWNFLWQNIGRHVIWAIKWLWVTLQEYNLLPERLYQPAGRIRQILDEGDGIREPDFFVKLLGVGLAILLVFFVGVFVGNLIGRTMWRMAERWVMRLPLIRAIYPSVKQVTDFVLADRSSRGGGQFQGSRVVAVQARHQGVWSIGLVTNSGYRPLNDAIRHNNGAAPHAADGAGADDVLTIFIPSSPTSVTGYVVVARRQDVVDLPLTVDEALRLLVSGGVLLPDAAKGEDNTPPDAGETATRPEPQQAGVKELTRPPIGGAAAPSGSSTAA